MSIANFGGSMVLAGDIGGTKTLLGLFDPIPARPRALEVRAFGTRDFKDLQSMTSAFLDDGVQTRRVEAACFGVAGPVAGDSAELTNVPWRVDGRLVANALGLGRVRLLNDLEAMACSVPVLQASELHVLQEGEALRAGNMAVIAAGTGLGQALLHKVDERFVPSPSEGGHADFAARTDREIVLLKKLTTRLGRVEVEQVLSGRGFVNIHLALHGSGCAAGVDFDDPDAPAAISISALEGRCRACTETLEVFVEAYGAEAGNLALRSVSTGGLFVGGGIAPKILPALAGGSFMRAFRAKAPLESMLSRMPVKVIVNQDAGLLGAAVRAANP